MKFLSTDFADGDVLPTKARPNQIGGEDKSPVFRFEDVPVEARSLALTCYDPDAPTGSGFWHWIVVNIPVQPNGQICSETLPQTALTVPNDAAARNFFGALPPVGDPAHRYIFTLHALSCAEIDAENIPSAFARFNIKTNEIASASTTATFANIPKVGKKD